MAKLDRNCSSLYSLLVCLNAECRNYILLQLVIAASLAANEIIREKLSNIDTERLALIFNFMRKVLGNFLIRTRFFTDVISSPLFTTRYVKSFLLTPLSRGDILHSAFHTYSRLKLCLLAIFLPRVITRSNSHKYLF